MWAQLYGILKPCSCLYQTDWTLGTVMMEQKTLCQRKMLQTMFGHSAWVNVGWVPPIGLRLVYQMLLLPRWSGLLSSLKLSWVLKHFLLPNYFSNSAAVQKEVVRDDSGYQLSTLAANSGDPSPIRRLTAWYFLSIIRLQRASILMTPSSLVFDPTIVQTNDLLSSPSATPTFSGMSRLCYKAFTRWPTCRKPRQVS